MKDHLSENTKHIIESNLSTLKSGGRVASKGEHGVQKQSKRGAMMVKMNKGGACK
jgi:hypothetical protein